MKNSRWVLKRVVPSLFACAGLALVAAGHASAAADVDCSPAAQATYGTQRRLAPTLLNLPTLLTAQQNLYSCHVKALFPELQQAVFLARVGQRVAHVTRDLISMSLSSCSNINSSLSSTLNDITTLQTIDSSDALKNFRADVQRFSDMSCARLIAQSYADDHFTDQITKDFCAYKRTIEALPGAQGSTGGFSSIIAPCFRIH